MRKDKLWTVKKKSVKLKGKWDLEASWSGKQMLFFKTQCKDDKPRQQQVWMRDPVEGHALSVTHRHLIRPISCFHLLSYPPTNTSHHLWTNHTSPAVTMPRPCTYLTCLMTVGSLEIQLRKGVPSQDCAEHTFPLPLLPPLFLSLMFMGFLSIQVKAVVLNDNEVPPSALPHVTAWQFQPACNSSSIFFLWLSKEVTYYLGHCVDTYGYQRKENIFRFSSSSFFYFFIFLPLSPLGL